MRKYSAPVEPPVPGLVPTMVFYGALARRTFLSTQYIRHHSVPFYTPEPDVVHEVIGHANMLGSPVFAVTLTVTRSHLPLMAPSGNVSVSRVGGGFGQPCTANAARSSWAAGDSGKIDAVPSNSAPPPASSPHFASQLAMRGRSLGNFEKSSSITGSGQRIPRQSSSMAAVSSGSST